MHLREILELPDELEWTPIQEILADPEAYERNRPAPEMHTGELDCVMTDPDELGLFRPDPPVAKEAPAIAGAM
jgi:hypothetical protein